MEHIGIDVHRKESQICILGDATLAEAVYANYATPRPTAVRFGLSLQRLDIGERTTLSSGGIKSAGFMFDMAVRPAPASGAEFAVDVGAAGRRARWRTA